MPEEGKRFGKYIIRGELGRGGFAIVYRAYDPSLDREIALKIMAPHLLYDPEFVERFKLEARVAASLSHPNIITIYEIGEQEGNLYVAMELAEGGSLRDYMGEKGPLDLDETVALLAQVADALDFAHSKGMVHRDIKPSNILLKPLPHDRLQAILSDFGLVKALTASTALTTSGAVLGTVEYMAPEQADADRADEIGPATDIYALGVVAYHMLIGQTPFTGSTVQVLMAHLNKDPIPPDQIRSDLPQAVSRAILKAMAKNPADRFPSAAAFVEALAAARDEEPLPPPVAEETAAPPTAKPSDVTPPVQPPQAGEPPSPPTGPGQPESEEQPDKNRRTLYIGAAVGLVVLLLLLVFLLTRGRGPAQPTPAPTTVAGGATLTLSQETTPSPTPESPTITPAPNAPHILLFEVDPIEFVRGQVETVHLLWKTEGADEVGIGPGIGAVDVSGELDIPAPETDVTYRLVARNAAGEVESRVRVSVKEPRCQVVTGALNLRAGPGLAYDPPIAKLLNGSKLTPLAYVEEGIPQGSWIEVEVIDTGRRGWVSASTRFVECNLPPADLPPGTPPPTPTRTFTPTSTPSPTRTSTPTPTRTPTPVSSSYTFSPPTIDGVVKKEEWGRALLVTDFEAGALYYLNDEQYLYLLLDVFKDTVNDLGSGDYYWLSFDVNLNRAIDANIDVKYSIPRGSTTMGLARYHGPGVTTALGSTASLSAAGFGPTLVSSADHVFWEFAIRLDEIDAAAGQPVRLGFRVNSVNPAFRIDAPENFHADFSKLIEIDLSPQPTIFVITPLILATSLPPLITTPGP